MDSDRCSAGVFDHSRQTGVVFHMLAGLAEHGNIGLTAVGDSPEGAEEVYNRAVAVLDEESSSAQG